MTDTTWDFAREQEVADPARGTRRVVLGDDGLPVRVDLPDGTSLRIDRDDDRRTISVTDQSGTRLVHLGATTDLTGLHRLTARDPDGTTTADVSDTTARLERDGAVLRVDSDPNGRPARVTLPGHPTDLVYRPTGAGCWDVGPLDGAPLLRIVAGPETVTYDLGAGRGWVDVPTPNAYTVTDLAGAPVVAVTFDLAGRIDGRRWHGGPTWSYVRDDRFRVTAWTDGVTRTERRYRGDDVAAVVVDGRRTTVRGEGGRVTRMVTPDGTISYGHDANGRRTSRTRRGEQTHYTYDALGQLTEVRSQNDVVRHGWDALGRRIWTEHNGHRWHEHRDAGGRLWSVTDDAGHLVHSFIWWDGRVLARCDAHGDLDEVYLTDPAGTLMGVATAADDWRFTEAIQPPFGAVTAPWRPTLFGHIADGCTPLICFGARVLDPETGLFLTPDPWHGGLDDPRHLGGQSPASLALQAEEPISGIHPYALSQGDPLHRPDTDGHFAWGNLVLTIFLAPTWGFPLTSVSVFFFTPLNIYFEIIALIFALLRGLFTWSTPEHPWKQHSFFNLRGGSSSGQLGTIALALNGFFPRATTGVGEDRCMTIGHVVWENRRYFNMIDRARVLELDDVRGTPVPATGRPSADARMFSDTAQGSILAVISTDTDRRKWIHGTWWTRGPGNAVGLRGATQSFEDRVPAGTTHARGTIFLAQPLPEVMPTPKKADDSGTLEVVEYLVAGGKSSRGELVSHLWFAFTINDSAGLAAGAVVEVELDDIASAYAGVLKILTTADDPIAVLDHDLPARFQTPGNAGKKLKFHKLTATTTTSPGWAAGAVANKSARLAAPPHAVATGDVFEFAPTGVVPAPAERPKAYSSIAKVTTTVELSPPITALALAGATLYRLTTDGTALNGNVPDPAAHADQFTVAGNHGLAVNDLVAVQPTGAGATPHHAKITAITPGVDPAPATFTVDPPFSLAAPTAVRVTRLKETDRDKDKGTSATQSGNTVTVEVRSSSVFAVGQAVLAEVGGARHVRRVAAITMVDLETTDELVGSAPYTLTRHTVDRATVKAKLSSARFVRHSGGDLPSSYGAWDAELMGLVPDGYPAARAPMGWRYFLKTTPAPAGLHPTFRDFFEPLTLGADQYWLLTSELKIVEEGGKFHWEPDPDDTYPRRHRQEVTPPVFVTVRSFVKGTVTRPNAGGGKVFAFPAETQVPDAPRVRWSLGDALADHELAHTVQNTYWGPLLNALPLGAITHTVRDIVEASGGTMPRWLDEGFGDAGGSEGEQLLERLFGRSIVEVLSYGTLMQLVWSFVILAPLLPIDEVREWVLSRRFEDWQTVFNPVNHQIREAIPRVDPDVPETKDWKFVLANFAAHALDLRSWTPFTGLIPTWLPDGATNFIEQQASRWTGDTYSTILTANDRHNVKTRLRVTDGSASTEANLSAPIGDAVRLLSYYSLPLGRNMPLDQCDAPGTAPVQLVEGFTLGFMQRFIQLTKTGAGSALVPAELYEDAPPPAAPPAPPTSTAIDIDGPPAAPGPVRFLRVPTGAVLRPRLRAIVPIPPAVMRAAGCYLLSASPATWHAVAYDYLTGSGKDDPMTAEVDITATSLVQLGTDNVTWTEPAVTGSTPTAPAATRIDRFITESQPLTVHDRDTTNWAVAADPGITLTPRPAGRGWTLSVSAPPAPPPLPRDARVRIWAKIGRDDPEIFDLHHDDVPTLNGRRSYLDNDIWLPVRDFLVRINDLPPLPAPAAFTAADHFDLDLPVTLAGVANLIPAAPGLFTIEHVQPLPPRGERWRFSLAGRKAIPEPRDVRVTVRYGGTPVVDRDFTLRVNPNFTLDKPAAVAAYEVAPTASLVLTINGGAGGFTAETTPPPATTANVAISGTTVTITVSASPAPAPPPVDFDLVVRDSAGHLGIRRITIRR